MALEWECSIAATVVVVELLVRSLVDFVLGGNLEHLFVDLGCLFATRRYARRILNSSDSLRLFSERGPGLGKRHCELWTVLGRLLRCSALSLVCRVVVEEEKSSLC